MGRQRERGILHDDVKSGPFSGCFRANIGLCVRQPRTVCLMKSK